MIRLIYNLLFPIALLFFLPAYLLKMLRRGNYRENFGQRLGFYRSGVRRALARERHVWIHAVSVGEVAIALKLAHRWKVAEPSLRVVLTTTTTTAYALASQQAAEWVRVLYNPLDWWPIVRSAFATIRPEMLVLVEAEVWPNLAAIAAARRIPIALVNARLSRGSERRFRKVRALVAPTFRRLDLVCVQEAEDVERWSALGVHREAIHHVGSIKFDVADTQPNAEQAHEFLRRNAIDAAHPILFAGSTHPGEERLIADVTKQLRREFPQLVLLIAPRHVERTAEIEQDMTQLGFATVRRSDKNARSAAPDCIILDTTGELRDWYAVGTLIVIGKSFVARGGQNPVEPISAGRPVIFGPNMENFAAIAGALVARSGAVQVRDADQLATKAAELLRSPTTREELVRNARHVLAAHHGATERTVDLLQRLAHRK